MILDYTEFIEEGSEKIYDHFFSPAAIEIETHFFRDSTHICKYCRSKMALPVNDVQDFGGTYDTVHQVFDCLNCGWWWEHELHGTYMGEGEIFACSTHRFSILRKFDSHSLDVPITSLRDALKERPAALSDLHPTKLEQLVGSVFRDHFDCEVTHLGRSGDGGIDLLLISGANQWVVQVKRRRDPNSTEGVAPIRELVGSMVLEGQRNGVFVTTASRFTKAAKFTAKRAALVGAVEKIDLVDLKRFIDLLNLTNHRNERPWMVAAERLTANPAMHRTLRDKAAQRR